MATHISRLFYCSLQQTLACQFVKIITTGNIIPFEKQLGLVLNRFDVLFNFHYWCRHERKLFKSLSFYKYNDNEINNDNDINIFLSTSTIKTYLCAMHYLYLLDIDECGIKTDNCSINAMCNNTEGSFNCTCWPGYTGNGISCTGN